jgi:hypothetical protein
MSKLAGDMILSSCRLCRICNVERIRDVVRLRLAGAAPSSGDHAESVRRSSAIGAYRLRCDTVGRGWLT